MKGIFRETYFNCMVKLNIFGYAYWRPNSNNIYLFKVVNLIFFTLNGYYLNHYS